MADAVTDLQEQVDDLEVTIAALADQLDALSRRR